VVHNYIASLETVLNFYAKTGWKLDQVIFIPLGKPHFTNHIVFIVLIKETQNVKPTAV
jgi:hypothetical protein